jgi:hypothetical protein
LGSINYSGNKIPTITERKKQLLECKEKLLKFKYAVPIRLKSIMEIEKEEYVYDVSIEGNENFLTDNNIFAHNSAFTNLSIMDEGFLKGLFDGYKIPDPSDNTKFHEPDFKSTKELSKIFFEC